jgi:hypothetical protein
VHQVGGFFGAWLGGVAVEHSGSYTPLWIADIALAASPPRCSSRSCAHGQRLGQRRAQRLGLDGFPQQRPDA